MFPIFRSDKKKKNLQLSTAEAFNLWNILNSKYAAIERLNLWSNYIHDKDFLAFMRVYLNHLNAHKEILEKTLNQFGIKAPDSHTLTTNPKISSDFFRDQLIATDMFITQQELIEMLLLAIGSSTRNDGVRQMFIRFVKKDLDLIGTTIRYLKTKGWLYVPPKYSQTPDVNIKIDAGEVFNLWSHLTYRYDNLSLTEIFLTLVNDADLKAFLKTGQLLLLRQIKALEKELQHFGIVMPIKPPATLPPNPLHGTEDDVMLRVIFSGITGALSVHAKAVKQTTTNDRIRDLFKQLLLDEIYSLDKTIKFAKVKGWLHPVPTFREF